MQIIELPPNEPYSITRQILRRGEANDALKVVEAHPSPISVI